MTSVNGSSATVSPNSGLSLVTAIYRTTNALVRELDRRLSQDHNVTFIQAVTLLAIDAYDQPQPHLVAEHLSQQSQTVTGVLDRLERASLVARVRDLNDRRGVRLNLTTDGRELVTALKESLDAHLLALLNRVPPERQERLQIELDLVEASVREVATS
jgi:DNA-binding MarR family transcriptional regulator